MDMDTSGGVVQQDAQALADDYGEDMQEDDPALVKQCHLGLDYPQPSLGLTWNKPVAVCSFVYRYHDNDGQGAMKYQPVSCSEILLPAHCDELRRRRGHGAIQFQFEMKLEPGCKNYERKVMTVPTIGCPGMLTQLDFCKSLLWAAHARERPTVLVVHADEADVYMQFVRDKMEACGVGIVAWRSTPAVYGFGVSRLAAQQLGQDWGDRSEVVMCDVNVANLNNLQSGYDSDREDKVRKAVRSTTLYMSAGQGAGTPRRTWDDGSLKKKRAEGGKGRPLEQVVTVGDELLYDPCFITSAEDGDMTAGFLDEENRMRQRGAVSSSSFRGAPKIEKVDLGTDFRADAYGKARDAYLKSLDWEDQVLIVYREDQKEKTVTVGALAAEFAKTHGLNADHIRSLIIEKILLQHKWS